jgi:hypothetical protein
MTFRALLLGVLLGLTIAGITYFNDAVIRQTFLVGNHLPVGIFGVLLLLLLGINPLLGRLSGGDSGAVLRPAEFAVIVALGLAGCSWSGSNYYRGLVTITSMPQHWEKAEASWKASEVMSYVPGGSARIAPGHVADWRTLLDALVPADDNSAEIPQDAVWAEAWNRLDERGQRVGRDLQRDASNPSDQTSLRVAINDQLIEPWGDRGESLAEFAVVNKLASPQVVELVETLQADLSEAGELEAELSSVVSEVEALRRGASDAESNGLAELADQEQSLRRELGQLYTEASRVGKRANRLLLVESSDGGLLGQPEGEGMLLGGGQVDGFVLDTLLTGEDLSFSEIPWGAWWPTIRLWGSVALLLGVACLALSLIVHPQWAHRELLPYPIARFVTEMIEREDGRALPNIAYSKIFWIGLTVPLFFHTVNGLHEWFEAIPEIPLQINFNPLKALFPNAAKVPGSGAYFNPTIFFSVIGFSFFLTTSISFSLGVSQLMFVILGAMLIANGEILDNSPQATSKGAMLRVGAYMAMTLIILYTGRRYYLNLVGSMVGLSRNKETPLYAVVSGWVLLTSLLLAIYVLTTGGLSWPFAAALVILIMILMLVLARVAAETGLYFLQSNWLPIAAITGFIGAEAIGPSAFLFVGVASFVLSGDMRESLMPFVVNGLRIVDRKREENTPRKIAPWLLLVVVGSFLVAGAVTFYIQHTEGVNSADSWARRFMPTMTFNALLNETKEMASNGTLVTSTAAEGLERLQLIQFDSDTWTWIIVGASLLLITAAARLRLPWWPLHPVAFLVWGIYPITQFSFSFLLGWLVKVGVMKAGGAKAYHDVKPLMVGLIGGEIIASLLWIIVGTVYYFYTGIKPTSVRIFPG